MPRQVKDYTGQSYGRMTVKVRTGTTKNYEGLWECQCKCGHLIVVRADHLRTDKTKSCGCLNAESSRTRMTDYRERVRHPHWKGGRRKSSNGYTLLLSPEHPHARSDGCVFEHRLVMEQRLGRYLLPEESVHHKNGDRQDNRDENLELWSRSHPSGQRVEDLVEWARRILQRYSNVGSTS